MESSEFLIIQKSEWNMGVRELFSTKMVGIIHKKEEDGIRGESNI